MVKDTFIKNATIIETQLRTVGDEVAVILPKEILAETNLKPDDILLVQTEYGYQITAKHKDETFLKQMPAAKEGMQSYRNALRELAK